MKKLLTLLLLALSFSLVSAQTPFWGGLGDPNSTFDGGLNDWTALAVSSAVMDSSHNALWIWRADASASAGAYWGTRGPIASGSVANGAAVFNSDLLDNGGIAGNSGAGLCPGPHRGELISPTIDCSRQTSVAVRFHQYFRNFQSSALIGVSNDDGATWATVNIPINDALETNNETPNDSRPMIDISRYAAGQSKVKIKFIFDGNYYFWIIDDVQLVNLDPNKSRIFGSAHLLDTIDCQNIRGWPSPKMRITAGNDFTFTDPNGHYSMSLDKGQYEVRATPPAGDWHLHCPNSMYYDVSITKDSTIIKNLDFGLKSTVECPLLDIKLSMARTRWCFFNAMTLSYSNFGLTMDTNAIIDLQLPANSELRGASLQYVALGNGLYRFTLSPLRSGEQGTILLEVYLDCNQYYIGRAYCPKAGIYPRYNCPPKFPLPPYDVHVTSHCELDTAVFVLTNSGTQSVSSYYLVYKDNVRVDSSGISFMPVESKQVRYFPNDGTYILALSDGDSEILNDPWEGLEPCNRPAPQVNYLEQFTHRGPRHESRLCRTIRGSFDPNEKTAVPDGSEQGTSIHPNTPLHYFIYFQNTGNDTAFRVEITDILPLDVLDIESLQPGPSSHANKMEFVNGMLRFIIDPITLPDSTTNEKESQGYVSFYIKQKADLPDFTEISNRANIIFDHNPAIITNTLKHIVMRPTRGPKLKTQDQKIESIIIKPNPSNGYISVLTDLKIRGVRAYNQIGESVSINKVGDSRYFIPRSGIYFVEITTDLGVRYERIIIVN